MGKIIGKILTYSVYVLVPALLVHLNIVFRTAQGERTEEILAGIVFGILFDFLYSIVLLIINRRSKVEMVINIMIAALLAPVNLFFIICLLSSL